MHIVKKPILFLVSSNIDNNLDLETSYGLELFYLAAHPKNELASSIIGRKSHLRQFRWVAFP